MQIFPGCQDISPGNKDNVSQLFQNAAFSPSTYRFLLEDALKLTLTAKIEDYQLFHKYLEQGLKTYPDATLESLHTFVQKLENQPDSLTAPAGEAMIVALNILQRNPRYQRDHENLRLVLANLALEMNPSPTQAMLVFHGHFNASLAGVEPENNPYFNNLRSYFEDYRPTNDFRMLPLLCELIRIEVTTYNASLSFDKSEHLQQLERYVNCITGILDNPHFKKPDRQGSEYAIRGLEFAVLAQEIVDKDSTFIADGEKAATLNQRLYINGLYSQEPAAQLRAMLACCAKALRDEKMDEALECFERAEKIKIDPSQPYSAELQNRYIELSRQLGRLS